MQIELVQFPALSFLTEQIFAVVTAADVVHVSANSRRKRLNVVSVRPILLLHQSARYGVV
jgi:hypothetical protein